MCKSAISSAPEMTQFKNRSLGLLLSGIALVVVGIAIAWKIPRREVQVPSKLLLEIRNGLRTLPLVAGTILTWVGGIRVSLVIRPVYAILFGLGFVVVATFAPVAMDKFLIDFKNFNWTVEYTLPIYALQITGFILLSTGLLRFLFRNRIS